MNGTSVLASRTRRPAAPPHPQLRSPRGIALRTSAAAAAGARATPRRLRRAPRRSPWLRACSTCRLAQVAGPPGWGGLPSDYRASLSIQPGLPAGESLPAEFEQLRAVQRAGDSSLLTGMTLSLVCVLFASSSCCAVLLIIC